jgi:hypothetical protein
MISTVDMYAFVADAIGDDIKRGHTFLGGAVGFMSVRPSAWNVSATTGQIFIKFDYCRADSSFIKIGKELFVVYMKPCVHFLVSLNSSWWAG